MINRRNIVWQLPLLFLITFPLWKIPVGNFLAPRGGYDPEFSKKLSDKHNFVLDQVKISQTEDGKKTTDIQAKTALTGREPNDFILRQVNANLIGADGLITNVKAQHGLYNTETKRLKLTKKVVVHRPSDNYKLFTELLYYYNDTRMISCPGKTRILGETAEIKGSSLEYDIEQGSYVITGRVYCDFNGFISP
jgi:LPS export ABC transporter protein LptC